MRYPMIVFMVLVLNGCIYSAANTALNVIKFGSLGGEMLKNSARNAGRAKAAPFEHTPIGPHPCRKWVAPDGVTHTDCTLREAP
jgi:hypothetical protein